MSTARPGPDILGDLGRDVLLLPEAPSRALEGNDPGRGHVALRRRHMELLVVRHAIAAEREDFAKTGEDDARRPLTADGRRKFEKGARGLREVAGAIDLLATSSLDRATQTADILEAAWDGKLRVVPLKELEPDADPAALLSWLRRQTRKRRVAVVGHEPHLSTFVSHALGGGRQDLVELKKGGACLLDLGKSPQAGRARLLWLLTAAQLRRMGR